MTTGKTSPAWHSVSGVRRDQSGAVSAQAGTPGDSPWFSGHFPGEPILPGIAQLHMALEALRAATPEGFRLIGVRRVRFKQVIRPEEPLTVTVKPETGKEKNSGTGRRQSRWSFQIKRNDDIACMGALIMESLENRQEGEPTE
jgi:3-hydroxymyristoyl/3-hydroxydecanoyl-(acyl carrier protein) dehydratase